LTSTGMITLIPEEQTSGDATKYSASNEFTRQALIEPDIGLAVAHMPGGIVLGLSMTNFSSEELRIRTDWEILAFLIGLTLQMANENTMVTSQPLCWVL
jgi:hypothetical protein